MTWDGFVKRHWRDRYTSPTSSPPTMWPGNSDSQTWRNMPSITCRCVNVIMYIYISTCYTLHSQRNQTPGGVCLQLHTGVCVFHPSTLYKNNWLDRWLICIYICERSLEMCICLWPEFDCPEVTLCGWQDIKIQLLLLLLCRLCTDEISNMSKCCPKKC